MHRKWGSPYFDLPGSYQHMKQQRTLPYHPARNRNKITLKSHRYDCTFKIFPVNVQLVRVFTQSLRSHEQKGEHDLQSGKRVEVSL